MGALFENATPAGVIADGYVLENLGCNARRTQTLNVLHFRGWQSPREERDTDVFDPQNLRASPAPHDDTTFLTAQGMEKDYVTR